MPRDGGATGGATLDLFAGRVKQPVSLP